MFSKLLEQALWVANSGYTVFPCNADKTPACKNWKDNATKDPEKVKKLFSAAPSASLIGVPTGKVNNIDVLDIDVNTGGLDWYNNNVSNLPSTFTYQTKSGGLHCWFLHHDGVETQQVK